MAPKILVADSDPKTRSQVRAWAEALGVEVMEAPGAKDVVAQARKTRPALVLVGLDDAPEDGFAAADALKSDPATADIQVLAMSAHLDSGRTAGATEHAFEDFVGKPLQERELVPILRFHLDLPHGVNDAHPL